MIIHYLIKYKKLFEKKSRITNSNLYTYEKIKLFIKFIWNIV